MNSKELTIKPHDMNEICSNVGMFLSKFQTVRSKIWTMRFAVHHGFIQQLLISSVRLQAHSLKWQTEQSFNDFLSQPPYATSSTLY